MTQRPDDPTTQRPNDSIPHSAFRTPHSDGPTPWIDLGGLEFCVISGGRFRLDGGAMFGIIPRVLWEKHHPPDERHRIALDANCVVVRTAGKVAVIDTGNGEKMDEKERSIFALAPGVTVRTGVEGLGIRAQDVDVVVLSHLHMDHAGGASEIGPDGRPRPAFPEATVVVQSGEWEDALTNRSTMKVSYRLENLRPLEESGQLRLLNGSGEVLPGVSVEVAPGHTRWHQMVHLQGKEGHAVFTGDVLPTWAHTRGPYNMAYDLCPYDNMLRKLQLLQDACAGGWLLITTHDPRTRVGQVEEIDPGLWRLKR